MAFKTQSPRPAAERASSRRRRPRCSRCSRRSGAASTFRRASSRRRPRRRQKAQALQRHDRHRHREGRRRCICPRCSAISSRSTPSDAVQLRAAGRTARRCASAGARRCSRRIRRCAASASACRSSRSAITHGLALARAISSSIRRRSHPAPRQALGQLPAAPTRCGSAREIVTFPFYAGRGFHTAGVRAGRSPRTRGRDKLIVLLNFPNNPTGYMPTPAEGRRDRRRAAARRRRPARRLVVLIDDAYFGLFYHLGGRVDDGVAVRAAREPAPEPARGEARRRHQGALRVGPALRLHHLRPGRRRERRGGAARCSTPRRAARSAARISNARSSRRRWSRRRSTRPRSPPSASRRPRRCARAPRRSTRSRTAPRFRESFEPYPFNSGYFMCVKVKGVRRREVARAPARRSTRIGLIATSPTDIRVAFSCLELDRDRAALRDAAPGDQELR